MWSNARVRASLNCGEMDRGGVREEIVVENACGGKPGSHGNKVILLSHTWRGAITKPLSPHTPALAAEQ